MDFLKSNKYLLVLITPIFASVFYAIKMPVSYDEAWTFLNFTNNGFFTSITSYDDPNNHVLFSLITNITNYIPGLTNLFKIRLVPIVINILFLLLLFRYSKVQFGSKTALIILGLTSVLFLNIYYSYMARGYCIINLCFVIGLFSSINITKKNEINKNWIWFGISSFIGFATIPAYLYPFVTLNFFIFVFNYKNIRKQFLANLIVSANVLLFYLPIIYTNGFAALSNNTYVKPIGIYHTLGALPRFYFQVLAEISGIHYTLVAIVLAISCFKIYKSNNQLLKKFYLIFIFAPFILLLIHGIIPYVRVFNYYGIVIILLIILPLSEKINQFSEIKIISLTIILQLIMLFNFNNKINDYEEKDLAINITANKIIKQIIGNKRYLFNESLLATNLEFELVAHNFKNYKITEMNHQKMNADTIKNYDYAIIKIQNDATIKLPKFYKTEYYNVYKLK